MTLLIPLKSWQRRHFVGCFLSLLLLSMAISEGLGHGGISNSPGKPYFMHCSLILCLSSSRGRPWPSCAFCASTVWATKRTSHGCIRHNLYLFIPASSISSIFASMKACWSGLYDRGGTFVQNVVPSGMLSLWTAPGMVLTSLIASAKQSA